MVVLQIEHPVPGYANWKKVFDSDPLGRKQSGVTGYRIFRDTNSPSVVVDLEFDSIDDANLVHQQLQQLWKQAEGKAMTGPEARIIEMVDSHR